MRITAILLAGTAAVLAAAPASAQTFTGPRVEVLTGYDTTTVGDTLPDDHDAIDGIAARAAVGYDVEIGKSLVVGAEAGIGWSVDDHERVAFSGGSIRASSGRDIDLSVRLGAKVTPATLLYAKTGYANSEYRVVANFPTTGGGTGGGSDGPIGTLAPAAALTSYSAHGNDDGFRVGAGVEHLLGEHAYVKGEYRYTTYGDDVSRHQILVGAGWRF